MVKFDEEEIFLYSGLFRRGKITIVTILFPRAKAWRKGEEAESRRKDKKKKACLNLFDANTFPNKTESIRTKESDRDGGSSSTYAVGARKLSCGTLSIILVAAPAR